MVKALKILMACLLVLALSPKARSQDSPPFSLRSSISSINKFTDTLSVEKLYLQTDKPHYTAGDTLWLKAYLLDGKYLTASPRSGVLYLEIAGDSNQVAKRVMLPVAGGLSWGQVPLDPMEMPPGQYTLRAYTNWMRNFGEDYVFKKQFYISSASNSEWLIDYRSSIDRKEGEDRVRLGLKFKQPDGAAVNLREMQLQVRDGKRSLAKSEVTTNPDGLLNVNFGLPDKADSKRLALIITDKGKDADGSEIQVPLLLNRPGNTDLQFMPEGGSLVANLPAHVAFKGIGEDGMGADVYGKVYDSKLREVAELRTTHRGMGTFDFVPQPGETYSAKIELPDSSFKTYALPEVKNTGITLKVNNPLHGDSVEVIVSATPDVMAAGGTNFLIGQARGVACYGSSFVFKGGPVRQMVSKKIFPSGVARFTVASPGNVALSERIFFIDHDDDLKVRVTGHKTLYKQRDSVALTVEVTDSKGAPVQGSFSLTVTDDGQVKTDSLTDGTILTNLLLGSDLKGHIEDPGYYAFPTKDANQWRNLDQLLLAQGWVGYDWEDAFEPPKTFPYAAEREFLVKGRVMNALNKPMAKAGVVLMSKRPLLVLDTLTNDRGAFTFRGVFPTDKAAFFVQARNKGGKSFNVAVEVEEFEPPIFAPSLARLMPWNVNLDTTRLAAVNRQVELRQVMAKATGSHLLQEVVVTGKKIILDSKNLNGPGEADFTITGKELEKEGTATLGDLLYEKVPGFELNFPRNSNERIYMIDKKRVHLIIDGIETDFVLEEGVPQKEHLDYYFDYYNAKEIKGIEVMWSSGYQINYAQEYLEHADTFNIHAFIEVTTWGGKGPFMQKKIGTYAFKPLPFSLPRKFYAPRYKPASTADITDIRSTLFWEPHVVTGSDGKATVTFYTSDNPGSYSVTVEGTDMKGGLGVGRSKILVER